MGTGERTSSWDAPQREIATPWEQKRMRRTARKTTYLRRDDESCKKLQRLCERQRMLSVLLGSSLQRACVVREELLRDKHVLLRLSQSAAASSTLSLRTWRIGSSRSFLSEGGYGRGHLTRTDRRRHWHRSLPALGRGEMRGRGELLAEARSAKVRAPANEMSSPPKAQRSRLPVSRWSEPAPNAEYVPSPGQQYCLSAGNI